MAAESTSGAEPAAKYDVDFQWHHSHGHIVRLLADREQRGVVLDVGCGYAPHAEPLRDAGFTYVGLDVDTEALAALRARGFTAAHVDLHDSSTLADALDEALGALSGDAQQDVVGVLALDVLEHLVAPQHAIEAIVDWMRRHDTDVFGVSIPNFSHRDVVVKLLNARWDITSTGLLDETHLRFFTSAGLTDLMHGCGLVECGRRDVSAAVSEQHFPIDNPVLSEFTAIGDMLRQVRARSDDHGETFQFVRLYRVADGDELDRLADATDVGSLDDSPFLSVLVEPGCDVDVIRAALDAQTCDSFELVTPPVLGVGATGEAADIDAVLGGMLASATGRYVTLLGSDQIPTEAWVDGFRRAAQERPGATLRCAPSDDVDSDRRWSPIFDLAEHLVADETPSGALAVPVETLRSLRIPFATRGLAPAHSLLLDVAPICGVVDTHASTLSVTSPWRRTDVDGPLDQRRAEMSMGSILLGAGSTAKLVERAERLAKAEARLAELVDEVDALRSDNVWLNAELASPPVRVIRKLLRRPRGRVDD